MEAAAVRFQNLNIPEKTTEELSHLREIFTLLIETLQQRATRWQWYLCARITAAHTHTHTHTHTGVQTGVDLLSSKSNISTEDILSKLTPFPPCIEPIAVKPLLFDLALTTLHAPDLSAHVKVDEKKGILGRLGTGLLGSLWGKK
eukprot:GHVR01017450.1.p1 GENE.GHVR01017450.1~~GHVR01017450.1.p1  ORF type:complete len:145 (-),score=56.20 GHVR01017450.1:273-707(-)